MSTWLAPVRNERIRTQLGILDPAKVPVKGAETARTLLDWAGIETPA